MDLLNELESLASLAQMADNASHAQNEAIDFLNKHFTNLLQHSITQGMVPLDHPTKTNRPEVSNHTSKTTYLVKLEAPLDTASKIQHLAGLLTPPAVHKGVGETGAEALFCKINGIAKARLRSALSLTETLFTPTFIRINLADKTLSSYSAAPTLGSSIVRDPTLPQFRAPHPEYVYLPTQAQYPVWYFFYGTLADPGRLIRILDLAERPVLERAVVYGGRIVVWGGKYKGLVDAPGSAVVEGLAYEIFSEEEEEKIRYYETDRYEVVRCDIWVGDERRRVKGLTFRLLGDEG